MDVAKGDALATEEVVCPILSMLAVASFDEAITLAKDTPYGHCASLLIASAKREIRGVQTLRDGNVMVNSPGEGDISTPFGG